MIDQSVKAVSATFEAGALSAGPLSGSSLPAGDSIKGTAAVTVVPFPFERTSMLPPNCLTRSRIPRNPTPAVAPEAIFDRVS